MTEQTTIISTDEVTVRLGGLPVLRSVSMAVAPGEAVALLGANGSGKTTLLRAILGLTPIHSGSVQLFGTELANFKQWHRLGYVPQRSSIKIPQATVREVVASGRLAQKRLFPNREDRERTAQALEQVGLADRSKDPIRQLSGGQQQRALIARALVGQPEILLLDEPFAGVDLSVQETLAHKLADLKAQGMSLLIVLHETGAISPVIDRQVVLRDGRVLPNNSLYDPGLSHGHETKWPKPDELLKHPVDAARESQEER